MAWNGDFCASNYKLGFSENEIPPPSTVSIRLQIAIQLGGYWGYSRNPIFIHTITHPKKSFWLVDYPIISINITWSSHYSELKNISNCKSHDYSHVPFIIRTSGTSGTAPDVFCSSSKTPKLIGESRNQMKMSSILRKSIWIYWFSVVISEKRTEMDWASTKIQQIRPCPIPTEQRILGMGRNWVPSKKSP